MSDVDLGGEEIVRLHLPELWESVNERYSDVSFLHLDTALGPVECSRCGASVLDEALHRQWHRDLTFGIHAAAFVPGPYRCPGEADGFHVAWWRGWGSASNEETRIWGRI